MEGVLYVQPSRACNISHVIDNLRSIHGHAKVPDTLQSQTSSIPQNSQLFDRDSSNYDDFLFSVREMLLRDLQRNGCITIKPAESTEENMEMNMAWLWALALLESDRLESQIARYSRLFHYFF
jgi:hypothetical protein